MIFGSRPKEKKKIKVGKGTIVITLVTGKEYKKEITGYGTYDDCYVTVAGVYADVFEVEPKKKTITVYEKVK